MSRHNARGLAIAMIFFMLTGCGHTEAPPFWLPSDAKSQADGYGGWASVKSGVKPKRADVTGELIAVAEDRLYVLTERGVESVSKNEITTAVVDGYDQDARPVARAWVIGAIASVGAGVWGIYVMQPLWALAGRTALKEAASYARVSYPRQRWEEMSKYARFPAGLPANIDLLTLLPKPAPQPPPEKPRKKET